MTQIQVLHWLQNNPIGDAMRNMRWLFPIAQSLHFVGLSLLYGAIMLVDFRVIGFFKHIDVRTMLKFIPIALVGFALNLVTGFMFFTSNTRYYWHNPAFKIKMLVIALAGLNALWFALAEEKKVRSTPAGQDFDVSTKISAGLSLGTWVVIAVLARLIKVYSP